MKCLCGSTMLSELFAYDAPPEGETRFDLRGQAYRRSILKCRDCGHCISRHDLKMGAFYEGSYVDATYGDDGIRKSFERITSLPPEQSDNAGRVRRIEEHFAGRRGSVLDVGSGLCVFLHAMKRAGWICTALDPDERAARHAAERVGVRAVRADFMNASDIGRFDLVTFNKVLEHVEDPVTMLSRAVRFLAPAGQVYVELPDVAAAADGPGREEFFIEHFHIFSPKSVEILAARAGFRVRAAGRLREPSGKYTVYAFAEARA